MPTPLQIDQQIELEKEAIQYGLHKLEKNTLRLEEKAYASASVYGVASIELLLPVVVEQIEATLHRIHEGKNGQAFAEIHKYLADVEPLAAAAVACKIIFDKVFSHKRDDNKLVNVCLAIGDAIQDECQLRYYEETCPGLLKSIKDKYWHRAIGTHQKKTVAQVLINRANAAPWAKWGSVNCTKLGGWLLECVLQASNWFEKQQVRVNKKTDNFLVPTEQFLSVKDQVLAEAELFTPMSWPMLIEPNDWSEEHKGGYLLNEVMHGDEMVRRGDRRLIQGETPFNFLNKIQKVGYTLNTFTMEVAEELYERGREVGKFIPIMDIQLPSKPPDIADNKESRHKYKREAAEKMNERANNFRRSCRTRATMETARRFIGKTFYLPWSLDYRGRAYPIPPFLTPQDTDFGKSLIRFAEEAEVTPIAEEWLAFQVATTYGLDKASIEERLEWTKNNTTLITRIALDPLGQISEWEVAEEPFQFLAACDEYYQCVISHNKKTTGLMVATDATCSGLQILAGLAKDASTARLVNVLPGDRPSDAYKAVAEQALPNVPDSVKPLMDRKVVKRVVMTVPYNSKPISNRKYIKDALKEKGLDVSKEDLTATVQAVRDAMEVVVPGPMAAMRWIERQVSAALKDGKTYLTWTTPSGFVVKQKFHKKEFQTLSLKLMGRVSMRVCTGDGIKIDKSHHLNATAPNLIHSLDASLLHLSAIDFHHPIALIHDSVLCRATDMTELSDLVRQTYFNIFTGESYFKQWADEIGAEEEPPMIGDLEPSHVINSTYFFC